MPRDVISRELTARARQVSYHQRKALRLIGLDRGSEVGPRTLETLICVGWVSDCETTANSLSLSENGQELHDALDVLGWLPP